MAATRALARVGLTGGGVEVIASRAHERGFAAGVFKERVIAMIVEHPQAQKKRRDEQTVDDCDGGEIHAVIQRADGFSTTGSRNCEDAPQCG